MMIKWVRSAMFGKPLEQILANFDRMVSELEDFDHRTSEQMGKELKMIQEMQTRYDKRAGEIDKSRMVRININTLMTQHLSSEGKGDN